jgi:hypothetical protein
MSRYDLTWTEEKYNRKLKEGYGQGVGQNYKPWVTTHDFPSDGLVSRSPGWKTNRVYHFMSNNELRYFYILEWSNRIKDIREQYPLNLEDTLGIAENIGIKHSVDNISKFPRIMSTDFMITLSINGKEINVARTIKPFNKLEEKRVVEKYEIERRYWLEKNIDWKLVTENDISKEFASNVEWVHTEYILEALPDMGLTDLLDICEHIKDRLGKNDCSINYVTSSLDKAFNIERGTCLSLFKHLLAKKEIVMDMQKKITGGSSTSDIIKIIRNDSKVNAL